MSKPRLVTTTDELNALPAGSLICDADGYDNYNLYGSWYVPYQKDGYNTPKLPARVLYMAPDAT